MAAADSPYPPITVDPARLGGIDWLESTKGALTSAEKRRLVLAILRGQASALVGRLALALGRRPDRLEAVPEPPDSKLARLAEEACAEQPAAVAGHARRTWAYGRALATVDGERQLDDELFYVAALLHDAGLVGVVAGEDFTLRSAGIAASSCGPALGVSSLRRVQDAISAHVTPGATVASDGPEGYYLQAGAVLDLGGLRLAHLPEAVVDQILEQDPREGVTDAIVPLIRAEADAVPDGRFALLVRTAFVPAIRFAPFSAK